MEKLSLHKIKWIKSLHDKKGRYDNGCYIIEGKKMIEEALKTCPELISFIVITLAYKELNSEKIPINTFLIGESDMQRVSTLKTSPGILAVMDIPKPTNQKINSAIILDGIQDPGNLGTIIRTADWFGIKNIIASPETVDLYNPKVVQATMGSVFNISFSYCDLRDLLKNSKIPVYGAFMDGTSIGEIKIPEKAFLIIGNEANGISLGVQEFISQKISIPKIGNGESLNAALACAIICSHWKIY